MKNSAWITSEENRLIKRHVLIVIAVENTIQTEYAMKNRLCIADLWLNAEKYKNSAWQTQCQNCQRWGHSTRLCRAQTKCQICAENHTTYIHNCNICKIKDKECSYSLLKCANYDENHKANSNICSLARTQ
jgi:hypothetical protein